MLSSNIHISDTELEIMNLLWRSSEPLSSAEIFARLQTGWKYPTVTTLLGRLADKGAVTYEKRGKAYYYSPALEETAYKSQETARFMAKMHGGSLKNMLVSLYESRGLTRQDVEELRQLFGLAEDKEEP